MSTHGLARDIDRRELEAALLVLAEVHDAALAVEDTLTAEAAEIVGRRIKQWTAELVTA